MDPPYSEDKNGTATPDREVHYWLPNPLSYPGAEGQRQRLCDVFGLNTEAGPAEGRETDKSGRSSRTTEDIDEGRREDATDSCGSEDPDRDPESSTCGTGCPQREFLPLLGKSMAPSGGWLP
ncbi:hypothetical protein NDU88_003917 [Pleurodeles waltl]|uniref:Uncharacterized protein n=1 Tax=Pleurodeles waltl TaxID=8319 RepID=A0AAV7MF44_PLEWA|nr:hypothetical protein NDU88_003917 [Pleurodeles waltl]